MKTLIIPDVHNKYWILRRITESVEHDRLVCLGDYFDDFNEKPVDVVLTARYVRDLKGLKLIGNHDLAYYTAHNRPITRPNDWTHCSGWSAEKHQLINEVMHGHWENLRTHAFIDNWVLSHAGFSSYFAGSDPLEAAAYIETEQPAFMYALANGNWHQWLSVSALRGGLDYAGGPFWQDEREFRIIPGMNQLVGHTPGLEPRLATSYNGTQTCFLDTHLRHYATITDGNLEIFEVPADWRKRPRGSIGPRTRRIKNPL